MVHPGISGRIPSSEILKQNECHFILFFTIQKTPDSSISWREKTWVREDVVSEGRKSFFPEWERGFLLSYKRRRNALPTGLYEMFALDDPKCSLPKWRHVRNALTG